MSYCGITTAVDPAFAVVGGARYYHKPLAREIRTDTFSLASRLIVLKSTLQASPDLWYHTCMMQQGLTYPQNPADRAAVDYLPLYAGDRLTRQEFERRYQAHPEIKKNDLSNNSPRDKVQF
jgi:hypothetical protein